jgi:hypothetical protein
MNTKWLARRVGVFFASVPIAGALMTCLLRIGTVSPTPEWAFFPYIFVMVPMIAVLQVIGTVFPAIMLRRSTGWSDMAILTVVASIIYFCVGYFSVCGIGAVVRRALRAVRPSESGSVSGK